MKDRRKKNSLRAQKRKLYQILIALEIILIGICIREIVPMIHSSADLKKEKQEIQKVIEENQPDDEAKDWPFTKEAWTALKEKNDDFAGYLIFDSGIVEEPVMQARYEDQYLSKDFDGSWNSSGTPFLDPYCTVNSDNMTIYGHRVYTDDHARFSPLEKMTDQEVFDQNSSFSFYDENGARHYEIAAVLTVEPEEADLFRYSRSEFESREEKLDYINLINTCNLINTDIALSTSDHFMTLQTCRKWADTHIVIIAKEVSREDY